MDAKRQRESDLFRALVSVAEIVKIVGVSKTRVVRHQEKLEAGDSFERKFGSGGHNKTLTDESGRPLLKLRRCSILGAPGGIEGHCKAWMDGNTLNAITIGNRMEPRGTKLKHATVVSGEFEFFGSANFGHHPYRCGAFGLWNLVHCGKQSCANHHPSVNALKASVEKEWAAMSEENIRKCAGLPTSSRGHGGCQWSSF
ncbi:Hypothetical protein FKW44_018258 [Caligus rogercresseyi]|uniref:Uncharacterized protein n=1 Tax=Caligus rogercresseyi TaxID=217165 RepID=A0A7T8GU48_CALRO|nr:Hypothetical protein FKW44_018258 [Caligus rogercresseyi]